MMGRKPAGGERDVPFPGHPGCERAARGPAHPLDQRSGSAAEANFVPLVAQHLVESGRFRVSADTPDMVELFQAVARRVGEMLRRPVVSYADGRKITITFAPRTRSAGPSAPREVVAIAAPVLTCGRSTPAAFSARRCSRYRRRRFHSTSRTRVTALAAVVTDAARPPPGSRRRTQRAPCSAARFTAHPAIMRTPRPHRRKPGW